MAKSAAHRARWQAERRSPAQVTVGASTLLQQERGRGWQVALYNTVIGGIGQYSVHRWRLRRNKANALRYEWRHCPIGQYDDLLRATVAFIAEVEVWRGKAQGRALGR